MKILLDECVTKKLKKHLKAYQVFTVYEMGWNGLKNGNLLSKCTSSGFDMLLSIDKNISSQNSISQYPISLVIFDTTSSKIEDLTKFIPSFELQISSFEKGKTHIINSVA